MNTTRTREPLHTVCERIIANHQYEKVDGQILDAVTANAILAVWKALSEKNRAKYDTFNVKLAAAFAWRQIR